MATKKIRRFRPGGLVDSEGNPVRDGSGNPIMTGSFPEEDEITARGRAKNAAMFKSFFNRATGRGKSAPFKDMVATPAPQAAPARPARPAEMDAMEEANTRAPIAVFPAKAKPDQQGSGQTFGQAFAAARDKGLKTFPFKGKSFTTETKEDVAKRKTAAAKKRDDADFAAESARDKTTRSVAGSPNTTQNRVATQKDADTSATKRSIKDDVDRATKAAKQAAIQKDANTSAAKRSIKDAVNRANQENKGNEATSRNNAPRRKPEPLSSVRKPGTNINYENTDSYDMSMKRGGKVKAHAKGGMTRGDGICVKGKTKGKFV